MLQTARMAIEFGLLTLAKISEGYIVTLAVTSNVGGQLKQGEHKPP